MTTLSCTAEVSTTEEPDAGKPHVRDCAGGAGQPALLPRDHLGENRGQPLRIKFLSFSTTELSLSSCFLRVDPRERKLKGSCRDSSH